MYSNVWFSVPVAAFSRGMLRVYANDVTVLERVCVTTNPRVH